MGHQGSDGVAARYVRPATAAAMLGVSVDLIRRAITRGELRAYRPTPSVLLVALDDLDSWVRQHPVECEAGPA